MCDVGCRVRCVLTRRALEQGIAEGRPPAGGEFVTTAYRHACMHVPVYCRVLPLPCVCLGATRFLAMVCSGARCCAQQSLALAGAVREPIILNGL